MLEIKSLQKKFDSKEIFNNLNITLSSPNLYLLQGENGKGKSTLLRLISGIDKDYKGEILFEGKSINYEEAFYYDTDFNLYDFCTVKENLSMISKKYRELMEKLNLEYLLNKKVTELSKGEKARVGLVKALLLNKPVLLLDEPFAYLDLENSKLFFDVIKEYSKSHLVILINHKFSEINEEIKYKIGLNNNFDVSEKDGIYEKKPLKVKHFSISKKLFSKNVWRNLVSFLLCVVSLTAFVFSMDAFLVDKHKVFNESLDVANVQYLNATMKNREQENEFYDLNVKQGFMFINKLNMKISKTHFGHPQAFFITGDSFIFDNVTYRRDEKNPTFYVSNSLYESWTVTEKFTEVGILPQNYYGDYKTFKVQPIETTYEEFAFVFLDDFYNDIGYHSTVNLFGLSNSLKDVSDYLELNNIDSYILSNENKIVDNNTNEPLKRNEINLLITKYDYDKFEDFDSYFKENVLNKTYEIEASNNNFSLKSYLDSVTVKGYKVFESNDAIAHGLSIEVSNILYEEIKSKEYIDSPLSNPHRTLYLDKERAKNSNLYKQNYNSIQFFNFGEPVESIYIQILNDYNEVIAPVALATGILFMGLLVFVLFSLFKSIFNLNKENIYIMKKDGIKDLSITNILLIPLGVIEVVTLLISFGIATVINHEFNLLFFNKYAIDKIMINYYTSNLFSILFSIAIVLIIFVVFFIFVYKKLGKRKNKDLK